MTEKNKISRQNYWANISPEEKTRRMRDIAIKRQKKLSFKQKSDHAMKMVAARQEARKNKNLV